jgi:hypothetical protein
MALFFHNRVVFVELRILEIICYSENYNTKQFISPLVSHRSYKGTTKLINCSLQDFTVTIKLTIILTK